MELSSGHTQLINLRFAETSTIILTEKPLKKPFQPSVVFRIETGHLICSEIQMNSFYVKCNTILNELMFVTKHYLDGLHVLKANKKYQNESNDITGL